MKKHYFKPELKAYHVEPNAILATSYGDVKGGGTGIPGAKGYYGDDDYDEDF